MHPAPLPTLTCPCTPRSTSWLSFCGHSFSFSSWWQCVTRTPRWSTMSVSLADSPPTPPGNEGCPWGKGDPFLLLPRGTAQCRLDARGHSQPLFPRPLCQQAIAVGRHPALAAGPPVHREQHLLSAADARRAARPPGQLPGFPVSHEGQAWVRPGQCVCGGAGCGRAPPCLSPRSTSCSVPRVSRLLADVQVVLGGPSARRTLAALGKLAPLLRAAGLTGEEPVVLVQTAPCWVR